MYLYRNLFGFSAVSMILLVCACGSNAGNDGREPATSSAATALDETPAPPTTFQFDIGTTNTSIRIGSRTFPVGKGTLTGSGSTTPVTDDTGTSCPFTISAAASNPTFEKVVVQTTPRVEAQLELCSDISGNLVPSGGGGGTINAPASIKVKLTGGLGNCEIPCTTINLTTSNAVSPEGQDYSLETKTATLVDDQFAASASTCGFFIDLLLGLPSGRGNNQAVLALEAVETPTQPAARCGN